MQPAVFECLMYGNLEIVDLHRLDYEMIRAPLDRRSRLRDRPLRRENDDRKVRSGSLHPPKHVEPVAIGKAEIAENNIQRVRIDTRQSLGPG